MKIFYYIISRLRGRGLFLSMKFGAKEPEQWTRYDLDSHWNFECQIETISYDGPHSWSPPEKKYKVNRDQKRAEKPDFNWRRRIKKYRA